MEQPGLSKKKVSQTDDYNKALVGERKNDEADAKTLVVAGGVTGAPRATYA